MKILAVDTATPIASVALMDDDTPLAEYTTEVTHRHTARLMPLIDEMLQSTGHQIAQVDVLVAGLGPGSFTGVRIGVGTVKSIAYALQKPLVGVCTLDAIALNLQASARPVCAILDARRNEVYAAIYAPPPQRQSDILCLSVERLAEQLTTPCILVGNGIPAYREQIDEFLGDRVLLAEPTHGLPRASLLAQVALPRILRSELDDPMRIAPLYVRRPEAEMQYESGRLGRKTLVSP